MLNRIKTLIPLPTVVFNFLKALKISVGKSLTNKPTEELAQKILKQAKEIKTRIIFPDDYQIFLDNKFLTVESSQIPPNAVGLSFGDKTIENLEKIVSSAKIILFNRTMGIAEVPESLEANKKIVKLIANSSSYKVAGGGSAVKLVRDLELESKFNFLSTGGGAMLAFISKIEMPGFK